MSVIDLSLILLRKTIGHLIVSIYLFLFINHLSRLSPSLSECYRICLIIEYLFWCCFLIGCLILLINFLLADYLLVLLFLRSFGRWILSFVFLHLANLVALFVSLLIVLSLFLLIILLGINILLNRLCVIPILFLLTFFIVHLFLLFVPIFHEAFLIFFVWDCLAV